MKKTANNQPGYFLQYLSLAPVLAVLAISVTFSLWLMINAFFPDLLFYPMP
ncbi:MAG: PsaJ protein [Oculatellaceae cyanobacterium bins.114]|nr:PsaJ protein [Oculatellaceae cyanobacterium bins.114]